MAEGEFPDGRMQKLKGKPWTSWNLPEQPTDLDLRKLRDSFQPPEQYRAQHQSTPLTARSMLLFGTHPDSDFLSITKCPACGWLLKVQHANRHFLRDSRGTIVCKDSDLAIFGSKVLGKACHPLVELKDTYSRKITLRLLPSSYSAPKSVHSLRGMPLMNEMVSSKSRSGSHSSSKTDYISHSSYRSRSHTQVPAPPPNSYSKSRSGSNTTSSSSTHHSSMSLNSSSSKGKSGKSHSSSSSSWSSLRSNTTSSSSSSKPSGTHKTTQGSYTLSIPSEDMGVNESVEDLLMSNVSHNYGSSKHTVHIIATSNSKSKSASAATTDPDYDHHVKFLPEVPEKRIKLDSSHSRSSDYYHKSSSSLSHSCTDSHSGSHGDSFSKSKSKYSSSLVNGTVSSHGSSDSSKSKSKSSSMSSSSSHAKNDLSSSSKHHLRSTSSSTIVTTSKPIVAVSSLTTSSSQLRSHHLGSMTSTISTSSSEKDKDRDKDRSSSAKKKKRKRDKDEPRKIIPLKDRDFNPDKHCGVCVPGSIVPCKRSLTCKTHSMALRRAVTGRSQSFDALLAAHKLAKTEEKKSQTKEVIEEIAPPKAKKKKLSGSSSTIVRSSPNDLGTLVGAVEATSYGRSKSPDIEVIAVKAKPKPAKPEIEIVNYYPKKIKKICPLVYPYTPDHQTKFETFWYDPTTMERNTQMTIEEKNKFMFLLKHYKNPYFINSDDVKPTVAKSPREKRNVFSNWNASEKPIGGRQHVVSWTTVETKRPVSETDTGELRYLCAVAKK